MENKIKCPRCGETFDVEHALSHQVEERMQQQFREWKQQQEKLMDVERRKLEQQKEVLEEDKRKQNEILTNKVEEVLAKEKLAMTKKLEEQFGNKLTALAKDLDQKKLENMKLQEKEIEMMRRESQLREESAQLKLKMEKDFLQRQQDVENAIRQKLQEGHELELQKLMKQLEDQKKLAEEMKRKAEQGSTQLQGEVQELALEQLLRTYYPYDVLEEVPKGVRGADSIQIVMNSFQQPVGKIVYESKRTKAFSGDWIDKLKQDMIACKADVAILVTSTFPPGMDRFGLKDGVWICSFSEVRGVSLAIREMILRVGMVRMAQENQGGKMENLYKYLTSEGFRQTMSRVLEQYHDMQSDLSKEKVAMQKLWAKREKQIEQITHNLSSMFGSIKAIAGNELGTLDMLELGGSE